ncbi:hypothetical protein CDG76_30635 [Nostoc sp. 'Peltigera membranacea cyanobiont' 210A]|uniref:hypothetical protein n=1 Tax=Nostoc sp. 'Peltigera membranacea cyanobiont' 210A TaxID=2014529 RepID=UPI000B956153|nr:hypothetical protein [Nostoc sp. 'Peltigera membranacea cyanobiont' 210A]OYD90583.1 hypothetical protein CDG76_30635 [Nostoc sp. 'Peltigera membranacea cyanobiont' 210A]
MTNKKLSDLVAEVSLKISEVYIHPEYQEIDSKGYESDATLGDAYQAMVDLNAQIEKKEKADGE